MEKTTMETTIGERITMLRKRQGLTQAEFGKRLGGLSKATISVLESGSHNVTDVYVKLICNEFKVNEAWLRYAEGDVFYQESIYRREIMKIFDELPIEVQKALFTLVQHTKLKD
jgi:transcriptional regulator with XRE-family HTH domain